MIRETNLYSTVLFSKYRTNYTSWKYFSLCGR